MHIKGVEDKEKYYNEAQPDIEIIEEHADKAWTNLQYSNSSDSEYKNTAFYSGDVLVVHGRYKLQAGAEDKAKNKTEKQVEFEIIEIVPEQALLFRAEYNINTDADYAKGEKKDYTGAKITEENQGIEGEALKSKISGESRYARYRSKDNVDLAQGTVMMWVKPRWTSALHEGKDLGRHLFSVYNNKNYSIDLKVLKSKGTSMMIREANETEIRILSIDTNSDESQRWYKEGSEKWTHIAITWDSKRGIIKGYINGELKGNESTGKWEAFTTGKDGWLKIGDANKGIEKEFNGLIDKAKIYDKLLNDKQIKEVFENENLTIELINLQSDKDKSKEGWIGKKLDNIIRNPIDIKDYIENAIKKNKDNKDKVKKEKKEKDKKEKKDKDKKEKKEKEEKDKKEKKDKSKEKK